MVLDTKNGKDIVQYLKEGKIGILPTDTIYGIHCLTGDKVLFDKVIELKQKMPNMPIITLISDINDIVKFDVVLDDFAKKQMELLWPGPNTLIFDTSSGGERSFRLPKNQFLIDILNVTGPLLSTSANLHGKPHSKDINQAFEYFGDKIDFYVDSGVLDNAPSSIYKVANGSVEKLR